jgi:hypothetical protein
VLRLMLTTVTLLATLCESYMDTNKQQYTGVNDCCKVQVPSTAA